MANIDSNTWWQVTESRVDFNSSLYMIYGVGVYFAAFNETGTVYWQFQNIGDNIYQIRNKDTGINKQLGVCYNADELDTSKTVPCLQNSAGNDTQKWNITSWGDGTYKIWNIGNGSNYNMDVHPGNPVFMSSTTAALPKQLGQHWEIKSLSAINDAAFSTTFSSPVSTATSSSTSATGAITSTSATSTPTSAASTSNNNSSSGGLSTGASAGIGIGVALGVLLLAAIAAFFFWRRRKQRKAAARAGGAAPAYGQAGMSEISGDPMRHEAYDSSTSKAPKIGHPQELGAAPMTAELPGSTWAGDNGVGDGLHNKPPRY